MTLRSCAPARFCASAARLGASKADGHVIGALLTLCCASLASSHAGFEVVVSSLVNCLRVAIAFVVANAAQSCAFAHMVVALALGGAFLA